MTMFGVSQNIYMQSSAMILVHFKGVKPDDRFGGKMQFNMTNL
jgi:hypothetical protein